MAAVGLPRRGRVGHLHIADMRPEEAEEFFVYQYLIVARPVKAAQVHGLTEEANGLHQANGNGAIDAVLSHGVAGQTDVRSSSDAPSNSLPGDFQQPQSAGSCAADALVRIR